MSNIIIRDFELLLYFLITGVMFALIYDFLRLFRRIYHHTRIWTDIEDILFWIICFFASFYLLYYVNDGIVRFFAVTGAGIGMLLYELTLSRVFLSVGYRLFCVIMSPICLIKNRLTSFSKHLTMKIREKSKRGREHARKKTAAKVRKAACVSAKKK